MKTFSGYIAIIGRPNVGKSTLLNHLIDQKISITSPKPQTTRHRILGIKTIEETQFIYVDTPGIHQKEPRALNRYMNKMARGMLQNVDVLIFVIEGVHWTAEDEGVLGLLANVPCPVILAINKIDTLKDNALLLPLMDRLSKQRDFYCMIPISAVEGTHLAKLESKVKELLPENPHIFAADQKTDRSLFFLISEIIREKMVRNLEQELPYTLTVQVDHFKDEEGVQHIGAIVFVERKGQKIIVLGKKGERIKTISTQARQSLELFLKKPVYLRLWVKIKEGWTDDKRALAGLGYPEEFR